MVEPLHRHKLSRPALICLALADRNDWKAGPAEVEVLVEPGDLGPPSSRGERQQQDRAIADRDRRRRRSLERERRGEPFGGDGRPAVVAAGVLAPGPWSRKSQKGGVAPGSVQPRIMISIASTGTL
jgi:hypothetical protein